MTVFHGRLGVDVDGRERAATSVVSQGCQVGVFSKYQLDKYKTMTFFDVKLTLADAKCTKPKYNE